VSRRRYYFVCHCSVMINATWRVLWSADLPPLDGRVRSALAELRSPSGQNYTLVDVSKTAGPLLRPRSALVIYLNRVVARNNIRKLLDAVHVSLTALNSGMLLLHCQKHKLHSCVHFCIGLTREFYVSCTLSAAYTTIIICKSLRTANLGSV